MTEINKIFAVIDPTAKNQRALNRATLGARSTGARIHAHACVFTEVDASQSDDIVKNEMAAYQAWIERLVKPIRDEGIEVDVEVEWHDDWRSSMGPAATRAAADLIIKNSHQRSDAHGAVLSSSDWSLFRSAPWPVMVAKSERSSGSGNVLLAVDPQMKDDVYEKVLEDSLGSDRAAVASYAGGVLHVLSVYEDSELTVNVANLARQTGVDAEHVHIMSGAPEQAIAQCAADINVELVVIGVPQSPKLSGVLFGPTAEWLLNHLDRDVMMVIPKN